MPEAKSCMYCHSTIVEHLSGTYWLDVEAEYPETCPTMGPYEHDPYEEVPNLMDREAVEEWLDT